MRVLIAIEPRSYREVLGLAIQELRPHLDVEVLEPETLMAEVLREEPDLVLSSRPGTLLAKERVAWIEFDPYSGPAVTVSWGDSKAEMKTADLYDLLSFVDETERRNGTRVQTRAPGLHRNPRSVSA